MANVKPAILVHRTISDSEANKMRDSYNRGDHELCSNSEFAFGTVVKIKREHFIVLIYVSDNSYWLLPLDRNTGILTLTNLKELGLE